jgi:outer membrane protein OmpA-like peptidoglycan-associated protein
MGEIIAPAIVADFSVGFQDKTASVALLLKIRRDTPLSQEEVIWLRRILASDLGFPVELSVETVPFVPLLIFPAGQTGVSPEMKAALDSIRSLAQQDRTLSYFVEAYPEKLKDRKKAKTLAEERTRTIIGILSGEYKIPEERIKTLIHASPQPSPAVKVSVISR